MKQTCLQKAHSGRTVLWMVNEMLLDSLANIEHLLFSLENVSRNLSVGFVPANTQLDYQFSNKPPGVQGSTGGTEPFVLHLIPLNGRK